MILMACTWGIFRAIRATMLKGLVCPVLVARSCAAADGGAKSRAHKGNFQYLKLRKTAKESYSMCAVFSFQGREYFMKRKREQMERSTQVTTRPTNK